MDWGLILSIDFVDERAGGASLPGFSLAVAVSRPRPRPRQFERGLGLRPITDTSTQGLISQQVMELYSSKESIRKMIWDYLEEHDLAAFPRPVHHRIPNFKGAAEACDRLSNMEIFQRARTVKVNPDKPQQQARFLALEAHKTLLVPTPRLRTGLFNRITPPPGANKSMLRTCSSSQGVRQYSSPVGLDAEVKVDLIIIGSVAVSPKGYRIGKGEGYADMEFAMMSSMGAVKQDTVVITTVHDCQVKDDLPEHLFGEHDLSVNFIVTPTRTIRCENKRPKPKGIAWELLTQEKFSQIPVLKILRKREGEMGIDVRLKEEREGCLDSSTASSPKDSCSDEVSHARTCAENPGVESRDVGGSGRSVGGMSGKSCASKSHSHQRKDNGNSRESGGHKSRGMKETGKDARYQGVERIGQSANSGQRSKGQRPGSGRRRDLAGMFAWN